MLSDTVYQTDLKIKYGELKNILHWCEKNCAGDWGYSIIDQAGHSPGKYNFKFDLEKDYVTFLIWKS
jgi:hypothetical protein